jgi:hypothetical protein
MDNLKELYEGLKEGIVGEKICREYLKTKKHKFFQADLISESTEGNFFLWEVKHQNRFIAPPFDGHGLPFWQFKARMDFYKKTKIRPILFVYDKTTNEIFIQFLDVLAKGKYFVTVKTDRIIFPIESFKVIAPTPATQ